MEHSATRGLSRADDLARELQAEIVTGRIPLGARLRQEDLAELRAIGAG
jgi:DNA-binding GntR family transcriptional regulator